jgi:hypothetical protein
MIIQPIKSDKVAGGLGLKKSFMFLENPLKLNRGVGYASAPIVLLIFVFVEEEILL